MPNTIVLKSEGCKTNTTPNRLSAKMKRGRFVDPQTQSFVMKFLAELEITYMVRLLKAINRTAGLFYAFPSCPKSGPYNIISRHLGQNRLLYYYVGFNMPVLFSGRGTVTAHLSTNRWCGLGLFIGLFGKIDP